jgi:ParB/RepB/Spo0J family partition protein
MITSTPSRMIPLEQLTLSEQNVRTDSDVEFSDLKASIYCHGLINPLLVTKHKDGYRVIAGGRRLRALLQLRDEGVLSDVRVPVQIATQGDAEELSLAENFIRSDLKPHEIYKAFAFVQAKKPETSPEQLAERFGMKLDQVKRVLRLGNLLPEILRMYAADEMTEAQAQAFASSTDHAAQQVALDTFLNTSNSYDRQPHTIRKWMGMSDRGSQRDLAFVGRSVYEAAGGRIEEDLFSADYKILDTELLVELVAAAKQKIVEQQSALVGQTLVLIAEPPKTKDGYHDHTRKVRPEYGDLSSQDEAALDEIKASINALDLADEANRSTFQALNEAFEEIEERRPFTVPAGTQITIDTRGNFTSIEYWSSTAVVAEGEAATEEGEVKPLDAGIAKVSQAALTEMGIMRRERLRDHVVSDEDMARNGMTYLTFVLARQAFGGNKLPGVEYVSRLGDPEWAKDDWMQERDIALAWSRFTYFGEDKLAAIAMDMVAMMVMPTVAPLHPTFTEWLGAKADPMRWISTPEFWSMFRKGQIFDMLDEVAPSFRRHYSNGKQDEVRAKAHAICTGGIDHKTSAIPTDELAAAATWVPTWLRLTADDEAIEEALDRELEADELPSEAVAG